MRAIKNISISILFCLTSLTGFAQTNNVVDTLEDQYQACLDKGEGMLGCSDLFYRQMDSLLNLQYKKLRSMCDNVQKSNLKAQQLKWLSKRDKQFKQNQVETKKAAQESGYDGGEIETMTLIDKNAMFVKARVIELMNSSPKDYSAKTYK